MSCQDFEQSIYTFRELSKQEQLAVQKHISTCMHCESLFKEATNLLYTVIEPVDPIPFPEKLTEKILQAINQSTPESKPSLFKTFDKPANRYALAAVSVGIVCMFLFEALAPSIESARLSGPIARLQGVVVNSSSFKTALISKRSEP